MECHYCCGRKLRMKILGPCEHLMCYTCLKTYLDANMAYNDCRCPQCRTPILSATASATSTSELIESDLDIWFETKYYGQLDCEECSELKTASDIWWCSTCSELFCSNCYMTRHRRRCEEEPSEYHKLGPLRSAIKTLRHRSTITNSLLDHLPGREKDVDPAEEEVMTEQAIRNKVTAFCARFETDLNAVLLREEARVDSQTMRMIHALETHFKNLGRPEAPTTVGRDGSNLTIRQSPPEMSVDRALSIARRSLNCIGVSEEGMTSNSAESPPTHFYQYPKLLETLSPLDLFQPMFSLSPLCALNSSFSSISALSKSSSTGSVHHFDFPSTSSSSHVPRALSSAPATLTSTTSCCTVIMGFQGRPKDIEILQPNKPSESCTVPHLSDRINHAMIQLCPEYMLVAGGRPTTGEHGDIGLTSCQYLQIITAEGPPSHEGSSTSGSSTPSVRIKAVPEAGPRMCRGRYGFKLGRIGEIVYAVGGGSNGRTSGVMRSCEKLERGKWTRIASMNEHRHGLAMVSYARYLYVFGGQNQSDMTLLQGEILSTAERYDPEQNEWTTMDGQKMSCGRIGARAIVHADRILIVGGMAVRNGNKLRSTEIFDPIRGTFRSGPCLNIGRMSHGLVKMDGGKVFAIGGQNSQNTIEVLVPTSNDHDHGFGTWMVLPSWKPTNVIHMSTMISIQPPPPAPPSSIPPSF